MINNVSLTNVTKRIKGQLVLDDVSYNFSKGSVYGIYGINGSGKTMLLRAVAGLLIPTSGQVSVDDKILHRDIDFPESIGLLIEMMAHLDGYTGMENMQILAKIKKIATRQDIERSFQRVGLQESAWNLPVKKYSLGMRQKLSIAQAIFEDPDLIIFDEPTNGLDDDSVQKFRSIVEEERAKGKIILIATHIKQDLDGLTDAKIKVVEGRVMSEN